MSYFLRINTPLCSLTDVKSKVTQTVTIKDFFDKYDATKVLAVSHKGEGSENPHIHCIFTLLRECTRECLTDRIKRFFHISGNGSYSLKKWDGNNNGAGSYMFHEVDASIEYNKGFTDDELKAMRNFNQKVQEKILKVRCPYKMTVNDLIIHERQGHQLDEYVIAMKYLYNLVKVCNRRYPGDMQFRNAVETIKLKIGSQKGNKQEAQAFHSLVSRSYSQSKPLPPWVLQCQQPLASDADELPDDVSLGNVQLDDDLLEDDED